MVLFLNQGHAEKGPLFDSIVICLFFLLLLLKCSVLISEKGERCDLTLYWNVAIEMTSLWHKKKCRRRFIPMQNFWQDSEHHVWIVGEKSQKGKGGEKD